MCGTADQHHVLGLLLLRSQNASVQTRLGRRGLGGREALLNGAHTLNINGWPGEQAPKPPEKVCSSTETRTHTVPSVVTGAGSGGVLTTGVTGQDRAGLPAGCLPGLYGHTEIRPSVPKQEISCIFPSKTH